MVSSETRALLSSQRRGVAPRHFSRILDAADQPVSAVTARTHTSKAMPSAAATTSSARPAGPPARGSRSRSGRPRRRSARAGGGRAPAAPPPPRAPAPPPHRTSSAPSPRTARTRSACTSCRAPARSAPRTNSTSCVAPARRVVVPGVRAQLVVRDVDERPAVGVTGREAGSPAPRRGAAPAMADTSYPFPARRSSASSRKSIVAPSSSNVTGNTTGDIWSRTTRSMLVCERPRAPDREVVALPEERGEERDPLDVVPVGVGEEDVARDGPPVGLRSSRARPSSRMPVPASRMTSQPSAVRSSTQGVLPPYRTVVGPGRRDRAPRPPEA